MIALLLALGIADTLRVPAGQPVSDAVRLARPGAVIVVEPGLHPGNLVVGRAVSIVGTPGAILRGDGRGTVVRITAPGVKLAELVVEHSGADLDADDAGVRVEADSAVLENLVIRDVLHGVYLKAVKDVAIRGSVIRGRAVVAPNDRGDGIHFFSSTRIRAEHNDIADVRDGMYFSYSDTTVVRHNTVTRSRYGLHYMFSHKNRFEDNWFTYSAAGSSIMNSRDVVARRNVFAFNQGVGSFGLLQQTTERTVLERNAFVGNATGLFLDGAVDGVVRDNLVADNFVGLELFGSSTGNVITGNAVVRNVYPATGAAGDSRFCDGREGNYWDDDRGWDLDGDGVHDVAYSPATPLGEVSRQRPALRLFLVSPAAGLLGWAERAMPVFQLEAVTDHCPLARPAAGVPAPPPGPVTPTPLAMLVVAGLTFTAGVALPLLASVRA